MTVPLYDTTGTRLVVVHHGESLTEPTCDDADPRAWEEAFPMCSPFISEYLGEKAPHSLQDAGRNHASSVSTFRCGLDLHGLMGKGISGWRRPMAFAELSHRSG